MLSVVEGAVPIYDVDIISVVQNTVLISATTEAEGSEGGDSLRFPSDTAAAALLREMCRGEIVTPAAEDDADGEDDMAWENAANVRYKTRQKRGQRGGGYL